MSYSHQQLEDIFSVALERRDLDEQSRFLDEACGGDPRLRERVATLLQSYDESRGFLEEPAAAWEPLDSDLLEDVPSPEPIVRADQAALAAPSNVNPETMAAHAAEDLPRGLALLDPSWQVGGLGRLGSYEVLETIGVGGMGIVLKARDTALQRLVAIKVLGPLLVNDPEARQRFLREAQAAAAVSHPHVVSIYAVQQMGDLPYLVMEYIAGGTLEEKLKREGRLELKTIVRIGLQIALGLAAAHQRGLIHRDITPGNILLEDGEQVKIADFGLAHAADDVPLTQTGAVAGTPQFMSPEQAQGATLTPRSDLFSFGAVLYAMCTGQSPFVGPSVPGVLRAVCDTPARPVDEVNAEIPAWLSRLIARLLAKDPAERYPSAVDVAEEFRTQWLRLREGDSATGVVRCTGHCGSCQWGLMQSEDRLPAPDVAAMPTADRRAEAEVETTVAPRRATVPPRRGWRIAAALSVAGALLLSAGVILLRTSEGTYLLETDDPQIAAQLGADGGVVVFDRRTDRTYTLRRGPNRLPAGDYELKVSTPEGLELDTPRFHLKRGDRVTATVRALEKSVPLAVQGTGFALQFDGRASFVRVPALSRNESGPATLEAWVCPESQPQAKVIGLLAGKCLLQFGKNERGWFALEACAPLPFEEGNPAYVSGEWTHLAVVADEQEVRFYVNGLRRQRFARQAQPVQDEYSFDGFWLGAHPFGPGMGFHFRGQIDEVRVSKTARYTEDFPSPGRFEPDADTLALYHCDEGAGTELRDSSGNGHHGTIVAAPWVPRQDPVSAAVRMAPPKAQTENAHEAYDESWSPLENLGPPVNTPGHEWGPHLTADGLALYFTSHQDRPAASGPLRLWQASRPSLGEPFAAAVMVPLPFNHEDVQVTDPTLSADGLVLAFCSNRTEGSVGSRDIWLCTRDSLEAPWPAPANAGPAANSSGNEYEPELSGDGLSLLFHSDRTAGQGGTDLWICHRSTRAEPFGPAANLGSAVNGPENEGGAALSADGLTLLFQRVVEGRTSLWQAQRPALDQPFATAKPLVLRGPPDVMGLDLSADGRELYLAAFSETQPQSMDLWRCERSSPAVAAPATEPAATPATTHKEP